MMSSFIDSSATTVYDAQMMLSFPKVASAAPSKPLSLHYHVIFHLEKGGLINEAWRKVFYKYLAGCLQSMNCELEAIGGSGDHVHLLINLDSTDTLADVVRRLKLLSQSWVSRKVACRDFAWQQDYQAFTVSLSQRGRIRRYILNQKEHNRRPSASTENHSSSSWGCVAHSGICG